MAGATTASPATALTPGKFLIMLADLMLDDANNKAAKAIQKGDYQDALQALLLTT